MSPVLTKRVMRAGGFETVAFCILLSWTNELSSGVSELSLERRIDAQVAIDRLYYSHQTGATKAFDDAVPESISEAKVRLYLKQSIALERIWKTRITDKMLQAELIRIARDTRFPDRLELIYEALDNDPILIQECFVRPILAERLSRSFFAFDVRVHGQARARAEVLRGEVALGLANARPTILEIVLADEQRSNHQSLERRVELTSDEEFARFRTMWPRRRGEASPIRERPGEFVFGVVLEEEPGRFQVAHYSIPKTTWEEWWDSVADTLDESAVEVTAPPMRLPKSSHSQPSCGPDDVWEPGALGFAAEGRKWHTAVWTGSEMLVWGGIDTFQASQTPVRGFRYDPLTDSWRYMSTDSVPSGRFRHSAVWTGSEMIVWGGQAQGQLLGTGGRYNPMTDSWLATSFLDAPSARNNHTAVWTGTEMVVWGGPLAGGRYDPALDSWRATAINAPAARAYPTAVWTGNEMIVWGGSNAGGATNTGGRYDPTADEWTPTSTTNAPTGRQDHAAVWTGSRMIVWGAGAPSGGPSGGRYDPITDSWAPTSTVGAPQRRFYATAVWTGERMIVWGGMNEVTFALNTGGLYDPVSDNWALVTPINAPDRRMNHTAVWTGDRMIVWGGASDFNEGFLRTGGRYDPVSDSWTPTMATSNQPTPRSNHTAVWTGTEMIVWGGGDPYADFNSGGRYDPLIDDWRSVSVSNAPVPRSYHTAVWTGTEMIVWGGTAFALGFGPFSSGGRYNPVSDSWQTTTMTTAPAARLRHRAVWTGTEMIVWGGDSGGVTGGRYDPVADRWSETSVTNAPSARERHTAIWTGSEMLVWGGYDGAGTLSAGAGYNPATDSWTEISPAGAPSGRRDHSAVWTGDNMVVWGGCCGVGNTGGLYDPVTDTWQATSTANAPSPRASHSAVWTGRFMIVHGGDFGLNTGGRYDPILDSWIPTSILNAPFSHTGHTSVWAPGQMIVWGDVGAFGTGGRYLVDSSPDADHDGFTTCGGDCDDEQALVYSAAPEVCDGRNNDCSHPGWPLLDGTIEADDDGDVFSECQGDCNDGDSGVWSLPGPVGGLAFTDSSTMTWNPPPQPGGMMVSYDTLQAPIATGFATIMTCVEADAPDTASTDMTPVAPGGIVYYLARAQNACGLGSAGTASNGTPRAAADCHPPSSPQGAVRFDN